MTNRLLRASSLLGGAAAAVTSAAASICCIGPLAIALLGVNGAILAAAFKPYRVYLLTGSLVLLAGAFWSTYRRARDGGACPVPAGSWTRLVLWVALGLWMGAVVIQYLANRLWLKGGVVL
ncbi:MAG TPA: mercuric transporter MerT family protein [Gemmatimonadales bacterium]|nr:mercuric transporter MerT family protein [Gemmatimonadales bacterium]